MTRPSNTNKVGKMDKQVDFSKLAHMLIDSDRYWEEEGILPPTPKEKHALHMLYKKPENAQEKENK